MVRIISIFTLIGSLGLMSAKCLQKVVTPKGNQTEPVQSFYDFKIAGLTGGEINMADYKGKYILCVNVASKCGHTPQYAKLEKLYETHKDQLVIIGFPCNQFLGQEPGSNQEIAEFCEKNYGVTFPLATKIDVKGKNQHPIYGWLTDKNVNGAGSDQVEWNFHKFLISPDGKWLASFAASLDPMSSEITRYIK